MGASPIVERLLGNQVSDTTLRDRRDEAIAAGVFEHLADEAVAGYDRGIGLDFSECSVDGSQHKAPAGGEGTGTSPVDRGKRGWKWSLFADRHGIPVMTTNVPQPLEASTPRWRGISHLALITADVEQPSASTTMSSEPDSWPRSASRSSERAAPAGAGANSETANLARHIPAASSSHPSARTPVICRVCRQKSAGLAI